MPYKAEAENNASQTGRNACPTHEGFDGQEEGLPFDFYLSTLDSPRGGPRPGGVVAALAEHDVVFTLGPEAGLEPQVEFPQAAIWGGTWGVETDRVARFQTLNQRLESKKERALLLDLEDFAAGLRSQFADVDEAAAASRGGHTRHQRVVAGHLEAIDRGVGCKRGVCHFLGAQAVVYRGHVVAHQNDDAARCRSRVAEVARGVVDGAVDVGAVAGGEEFNLVGDLALVAGQAGALLDRAGGSEQRDLVFR